MGQCTRFLFGVFTHFSKFSRHAWEKISKMLVFTRVYVCVKAKLTFISFFFQFFFVHLSLSRAGYGGGAHDCGTPLLEGIAPEVVDVSWNGKKLRKICVIF